MFTAFAGAFVGIAIMGAGSFVVGALAGTPPAAWAGTGYGIAALLGIGAIPVIGFTSTYVNLRCPACNGFVAWQVNMKYSAFGGFASNECNKCGATIFAPATSRRFMLVIIMVAVGFFLAATALGSFMSARRRHAPDAQPPASSAP